MSQQKGDDSWGFAKHRQGGHGKNASPTSRWHKFRVASDANNRDSETARARKGKRRLQKWSGSVRDLFR